MPYITIPVEPAGYQISFDDILNGINESTFEKNNENTHDTKTVFRVNTPERLLKNVDFSQMKLAFESFNETYKNLIETQDKSLLYRSFKIPKRSGGLRPIDAPQDELMTALRELKYILECKCFASYHTSAFAYVKGRCTIDAVKRHQRNNSRWFLKLDFHNFFGSTTLDFVLNMMDKIFPFCELFKDVEARKNIEKAISLCFLNGGLPQGTPISPTLTNLMMIPVDHAIAKFARTSTPHLVYTRYADDLLLSADIKFNWGNVQNEIIKTLKDFNAPFELNTAKTRFGSSAGRNWNLGVMLNKDNQITIGYQRKKAFKAMLFSLINDYKNNNKWEIEDLQTLNGLISYYLMVEREAISKIIKTYSDKYEVDVLELIKRMLKQEI